MYQKTTLPHPPNLNQHNPVPIFYLWCRKSTKKKGFLESKKGRFIIPINRYVSSTTLPHPPNLNQHNPVPIFLFMVSKVEFPSLARPAL